MSDFDDLLERLLLDPEFKAALAADPDRTRCACTWSSRTTHSPKGSDVPGPSGVPASGGSGTLAPPTGLERQQAR